MGLFIKKKSIWQKQWSLYEKSETTICIKKSQNKIGIVEKKVTQIIPKQLEHTLIVAFDKALLTVGEKGISIIEKTYNRDDNQVQYNINDYASKINLNKKTSKNFNKAANLAKIKGTTISCADGFGMGILGMGIPDIPVLIAVIFRTIYQIAMSFGFEYDSKSEQIFILEVIRNAMTQGDKFKIFNQNLNNRIDLDEIGMIEDNYLSKTAAEVLALDMICMKFIQGIPIIGVVGGLYNGIYVNKISEYAKLKYQRRFLRKRL